MSERFFIIDEINLNKINEEIEEYTNQTNEIKPYIFMNEDTLKVIENKIQGDTSYELYNYLNQKINGIEGFCNGCNIFINNLLKFGEIEIR